MFARVTQTLRAKAPVQAAGAVGGLSTTGSGVTTSSTATKVTAKATTGEKKATTKQSGEAKATRKPRARKAGTTAKAGTAKATGRGRPRKSAPKSAKASEKARSITDLLADVEKKDGSESTGGKRNETIEVGDATGTGGKGGSGKAAGGGTVFLEPEIIHKAGKEASESLLVVKQTQDPWDAVIVGGGHNGLITAAYLAKSGQRVLVLERRHVVGGAAITEELYPGFKFSRASYVNGLMRPHIVQDLNLKAHGLHFYPRNPSSFTPTQDGRYLMLSNDMDFNRQEISKFSKLDAAAYPKFEAFLNRCSVFFEKFLDEEPPDSLILNGQIEKSNQLMDYLSQSVAFAKLAGRALSLGGDLAGFIELMTAPAAQILNRYFESEPLISTLATDSIIGAMAAPSTPGSGYVLFHHVMGVTDGERGVWSYVRGGMGAVSQAIADAAAVNGATIQTNAAVQEIEVDENGHAVGVRLEDNTLIRAKKVISNATPEVTFGKLVPERAMPGAFTRRVETLDYSSGVMKINCALDRLPEFKAIANPGDGSAGPQHRGTIHIGDDSKLIERGYQDALAGRASEVPIIEMTLPSSLDPTISPEGKHVALLFVQYAPYELADGASWDDPGRKEAYAKKVFARVDEYAPGFSDSVLAADVLSPVDLERTFGLTGGNIFHSSMGLDQLFWLRPAAGYTNYRSPVPNLYMCGSGTHPGGGVMGSPGYNAARRVIADTKYEQVRATYRTKGFAAAVEKWMG